MNKNIGFYWILAWFLTSSVLAQTGGLVTPDASLRNDLMYLRDQGVLSLSLSTWPISATAIDTAISQVHPVTQQQEQALIRIRQRLATLQNGAYIEGVLTAGKHLIPNQFGPKEYGDWRASAGYAYADQNMAVRLQLNAVDQSTPEQRKQVNLDGSYTGAEWGGQWFTFGAVDHYWGPGHSGSLIYGDVARPVVGFTIQRATQEAPQNPWLSWIGPWNYQVSFGQLGGERHIKHAKLISMRATMQPLPYLELGAHRAIQWGGDGRSQSLRSLSDALLGLNENPETSQEKQFEPGNQIAGLDFRLNLRPLTGWPVNAYAQMIGEDEAGHFPAKKAYVFGFDGSFAVQNGHVNWFAELADTRTEFGHKRNVIYRHHVYRSGYYQDKLPLGYYTGGDGRSQMLGVHYADKNNNLYDLSLWHANVNPEAQSQNGLFPKSDDLKGVNFSWHKEVQDDLDLSISAWLVKSKYDDNRDGHGIMGRLRYGL